MIVFIWYDTEVPPENKHSLENQTILEPST